MYAVRHATSRHAGRSRLRKLPELPAVDAECGLLLASAFGELHGVSRPSTIPCDSQFHASPSVRRVQRGSSSAAWREVPLPLDRGEKVKDVVLLANVEDELIEPSRMRSRSVRVLRQNHACSYLFV